MRWLIIIFLFVSSFCVFSVGALDYFTFSSDRLVVQDNKPFYLDFTYDLKNISEGSFIVRPHISSGIISIYDRSKDLLIPENSFWLQYPKLSKKIRVQMSALPKKFEVWFEIQNLKTGEIHRTPPKFFWSETVIYRDYNQRLNRNLIENVRIN